MTHEPSQPSEEEKPQKSAMTSGRELLTIVGVFALLVGGIFVFFRSGKEPALPEAPVAVSPPATADPSSAGSLLVG